MKKLFTIIIFAIVIYSTYYLFSEYNGNTTEKEIAQEETVISHKIMPFELITKSSKAHWRYTGITDGDISIVYSGPTFGDAYFFPATEKSEILLPESEDIHIKIETINKDSGELVFSFKEQSSPKE